jgi:hypothetical protein
MREKSMQQPPEHFVPGMLLWIALVIVLAIGIILFSRKMD